LTLGGASPYPPARSGAVRSPREEEIVAEGSSIACPVERILVRIQVGTNLMSASDDPLFLGINGPDGREFRLRLAHGRSLRRGHEDHFVVGAPDDPETNLEHADLNDPTQPPIDAESIPTVYLRKGFEPIPNVRALGEMDDRLQVLEVEVEIHGRDRPKAARYARGGPIWLGLVSGLRMEIPRSDGAA